MTEAFVTLIFFLAGALIIYFWKWFAHNEIKKGWVILLFAMKCIAGMGGGLLYLYYYEGGDTWTYFRDSQVLTQCLKEDPGAYFRFVSGQTNPDAFMKVHGLILGWNNNDVVYNDNRTIIVLNSLIGLFSFGSYYAHVVVFSFLSLLGLMGIYLGARLVTNTAPLLMAGAVFLVPGSVFWLSMALKESLLIFAMGMLIYHCFRLLTVSRSFGNICGMLFGGFLFVHIKAYVLLLITPCLLAFIWVQVTGNKLSLLKYFLVYGISVLLFFNMDRIIPGIDLVDILVMKRISFEAFARSALSQANSYIFIPEFTSNWGDILTATPIAAFMVLVRPYIWEADSPLVILAAIENLIIVGALLAGFRYIRWDKMVANKNLMLFCLFFVFSSFVLIGLTTPIMGAIVRYRAPILPFLLLFPVLISGKRKVPPAIPSGETEPPAH